MRVLKFNPIGFFLGRTNNPIIRNDIENIFGGASSHALNVGELGCVVFLGLGEFFFP